MSAILTEKKKRKTLSLKLEGRPEARHEIIKDPTRFTRREDCVFMVYNENGHMPQRVYGSDEVDKACHHARTLARDTGQRFHVMRSWRSFVRAEEVDHD